MLALGLLGRDKGVPTASAARLATETLGWEAVSGGWGAAGAPRGVQGESGAKAGRRRRVGAVLSAVPAGPALAAPSHLLEFTAGEGTAGDAGDAVEVLKILEKRDPRSNTATFMAQTWKCCPRCCWSLKTTGSRAAGLHPPLLTRIRRRRPGRGGDPGVPLCRGAL